MAKRGQGIITVDDVDYFYSFGTAAIRKWSELTGKSEVDLRNVITAVRDNGGAIEKVDLSNIVFAGLAAGERIKTGRPIHATQITIEQVDDIVDLMKQEQVEAVLLDLMRGIIQPEHLEVFEKAIEEQKKKPKQAEAEAKKRPLARARKVSGCIS